MKALTPESQISMIEHPSSELLKMATEGWSLYYRFQNLPPAPQLEPREASLSSPPSYPFPQPTRHLREDRNGFIYVFVTANASLLSPPPNLPLQYKTLPCSNCRLTFPSGVSLLQKHSLYIFPGGKRSHAMGMHKPFIYPFNPLSQFLESSQELWASAWILEFSISGGLFLLK